MENRFTGEGKRWKLIDAHLSNHSAFELFRERHAMFEGIVP